METSLDPEADIVMDLLMVSEGQVGSGKWESVEVRLEVRCSCPGAKLGGGGAVTALR